MAPHAGMMKAKSIAPFKEYFAISSGLSQKAAKLTDSLGIPNALCTEIFEAYEFLMHVRLVHQLRMLEDGKEPDNYPMFHLPERGNFIIQ